MVDIMLTWISIYTYKEAHELEWERRRNKSNEGKDKKEIIAKTPSEKQIDEDHRNKNFKVINSNTRSHRLTGSHEKLLETCKDAIILPLQLKENPNFRESVSIDAVNKITTTVVKKDIETEKNNSPININA